MFATWVTLPKSTPIAGVVLILIYLQADSLANHFQQLGKDKAKMMKEDVALFLEKLLGFVKSNSLNTFFWKM